MKSSSMKILIAWEKLFKNVRFKNFSLFTFHFSLFLFCFCVTTFAQEEQMPDDVAPPPLYIISKQEKSSLDAETDISERTKLSLELMETRLKNAEDLTARNLYGEMSNELGSFNALMDNTLFFLNKNDNGHGKVLNNYKRLELSLRKFMTRLELIRRELPFKFEFYVRKLIKSVRETRSKAVEPMFSDTVVRDTKKEN
jgi:archaellum component FlaC